MTVKIPWARDQTSNEREKPHEYWNEFFSRAFHPSRVYGTLATARGIGNVGGTSGWVSFAMFRKKPEILRVPCRHVPAKRTKQNNMKKKPRKGWTAKFTRGSSSSLTAETEQLRCPSFRASSLLFSYFSFPLRIPSALVQATEFISLNVSFLFSCFFAFENVQDDRRDRDDAQILWQKQLNFLMKTQITKFLARDDARYNGIAPMSSSS